MTDNYSTWSELRRYNTPYLPMVLVSAAFHLLLFLGIPLGAKMLWRPKSYARPQTFQLVSMPVPKSVAAVKPEPARRAPARPAVTPKSAAKSVEPKPKAAEPTPAPKPTPSQPTEDLSELEELLGGIAPPAAQISAAPGIQDWYINQMRGKIESNWRPPVRDPHLAVEVFFTVHANGTISGVRIARGSGSVSLDNAAVRAVTLAAPFGKLPPNYRDSKLDVNITLIPVSR